MLKSRALQSHKSCSTAKRESDESLLGLRHLSLQLLRTLSTGTYRSDSGLAAVEQESFGHIDKYESSSICDNLNNNTGIPIESPPCTLHS